MQQGLATLESTKNNPSPPLLKSDYGAQQLWRTMVMPKEVLDSKLSEQEKEEKLRMQAGDLLTGRAQTCALAS